MINMLQNTFEKIFEKDLSSSQRHSMNMNHIKGCELKLMHKSHTFSHESTIPLIIVSKSCSYLSFYILLFLNKCQG